MTNIIPNSGATMTSREIAELVEVRHDSVKRSIDRLVERGVIASPPSVEKATDGRPASEYVFAGEQGKRDSIVVVAQLSPEFTARLVDRWQELEAGAATIVVPQSLPEALRLAADLAEQAEVLKVERDEAIRTKAQIGSAREASAMATASKATREADRLRDELGYSTRHATIIAVERATGQTFANNAYVALRRWCKANRVDAADVPDKRHGTVKAWPAGAWEAVFGVSLGALFGGGAA